MAKLLTMPFVFRKENPTLDIGAHLVLVQGCSLLDGKPLPETPSQLLASPSQRWLDVYAELKIQIEKIWQRAFVFLTSIPINTLILVPPVFRAVVKLADEFGFPGCAAA